VTVEAASVVLAGFGGQGLLLAGKVLAHAAMASGLEVSWLPSYGPEMRGGTANVTVCMAPRPIGSPLVGRPSSLVVMNQPSLEKFAPRVRPGGVIVVDTSMVPTDPARPDCTVVRVAARDLARAAKAERSANFVVLGAWAGAQPVERPVVPLAAIEEAIAQEFEGGKAKWVPLNVAALRAGYEVGRLVPPLAPPPAAAVPAEARP
jgi:2-oxoglutarate ferredoxin oxidoreductase subunit gamma